MVTILLQFFIQEMSNTWIILFCEILLIFLYFSSSELDVVTVDVHQAKDLVRSGHRYIDVRTVEEFNIGHVDVENPLNIPYMFNTPQGRVKNPQFLEQILSSCKKDDHLVVGCQSGVRSVYASYDLLNADFRYVSNMGGGYAGWVENGLGVKKPKAEL
ncbi:hypothetical protein GIB67_038087 [Kingdonia uniflora]|uniref:Rhodanese domain-containing protein n=1 Tax=Kingdonia uniflora TaxID=39325 RepID=A0A7J7MR41_9MAGN|nr:hypothetical protein GIB67_029889 [Kingdonia uniflora]KAF6175582.1 hypothetical protein GIB67_038086 [Kingdonia uniflora]KAF6175583.1 hypothetical protein GIB67_038087 [Kingdonia uniflora]